MKTITQPSKEMMWDNLPDEAMTDVDCKSKGNTYLNWINQFIFCMLLSKISFSSQPILTNPPSQGITDLFLHRSYGFMDDKYCLR